MFSKTLALCFLLSGLVTSVASSPLRLAREASIVNRDVSFNNYGGLSSLSGFDNFYGSGNFNGRRNKQVIIEKQVEVCRREQIEIVQQRLLVLREMARRVVTELVCDVETQVIVFEQFHRSNSQFRDDLGRKNGRQAGYDSSVVKNFSKIVDANGNLSTDDLGFNGQSVGANTVVYGGTNWSDNTSPASVAKAAKAAESADKSSSAATASASSAPPPASASAARATASASAAKAPASSSAARATASAASH